MSGKLPRVLEGNLPRNLASTVLGALRFSPVVAMTGPRTVGKSTLARRLADTLHGSFLDLDDPAVAALADLDPTQFIRGLPEPIVIDEFQHAPGVLAAIKAELNVDRRPGRFVLTGSARHQTVPDLAKYLTGRVELVTLWPFTQAELARSTRSVVDEIFDGSLAGRRLEDVPDRDGIVRAMACGGYPIAVGLDPSSRPRWHRSLVELVLERIADDVRPVRRPDQLRRTLTAAFGRTAQLSNAADLGRELGLGRDQAGEYLQLLEAVYLVHEVPAWSPTVGSRATKRPKLHAVDTGLACSYLGIGPGQLRTQDPPGAKAFGHLLETFVANELVRHLGWAETTARLHHYRDTNGYEVDLVLERDDGRVVGVEVKASSRFGDGDLKGLRRVRERTGDRFLAGLLLNTGQHTQRVDDRIAVTPVSRLWSA